MGLKIVIDKSRVINLASGYLPTFAFLSFSNLYISQFPKVIVQRESISDIFRDAVGFTKDRIVPQ